MDGEYKNTHNVSSFCNRQSLSLSAHSLAILECVEGVIELGDRRHLTVQLHYRGFLSRRLIFSLPVLDRLRARRLVTTFSGSSFEKTIYKTSATMMETDCTIGNLAL